LAKALETVKQLLRPGDLLITLGAGDVWKVGDGFLKPD
jgi:UDP-N-acetylmuramate-alanine ligase